MLDTGDDGGRLYAAAVSAYRTTPRVAAALASVVALAGLLAGCGDETTDDTATDGETSSVTPTDTSEPTSSTPTPTSTLPACDELWVPGEDLPKPYTGCFDGTADVLPEPLRCSSGQQIVTYDDLYWAVPGAKVQDSSGLEDDPDFAAAKRQCLA